MEYLNNSFRGQELTNAEILKFLIEDQIVKQSLTPNALGRILKDLYTQNLVTINNKKHRLYYL